VSSFLFLQEKASPSFSNAGVARWRAPFVVGVGCGALWGGVGLSGMGEITQCRSSVDDGEGATTQEICQLPLDQEDGRLFPGV